MFVSSKTFMELVERMTRMEMEHAIQVKRLEERIEVLEKRPIILADEQEPKRPESTFKLFEEMTSGVKNPNTGRVEYTDGRD